jgi:acyl carrier protein
MTSQNKTSEELIAWMQERIAQALECAPSDVDVDKAFDQLGLDSLAILIATGELAEWLDIELEAVTLFQYSTIRSLADHLAA